MKASCSRLLLLLPLYKCLAVHCSVLQRVAVRFTASCSRLLLRLPLRKCVAVCCSALQLFAMCCSSFQGELHLIHKEDIERVRNRARESVCERARVTECTSERESEIERMGKQRRQLDVDTDDEVLAKSRGFDCNIFERCSHGCV